MCRPCFASSTPSPEASFTCCQYHAKTRTLGCIFCVCRHSTTSRAFSNVCSVERHWEVLRCGRAAPRNFEILTFETGVTKCLWVFRIFQMVRHTWLRNLGSQKSAMAVNPTKSSICCIGNLQQATTPPTYTCVL